MMKQLLILVFCTIGFSLFGQENAVTVLRAVQKVQLEIAELSYKLVLNPKQKSDLTILFLERAKLLAEKGEEFIVASTADEVFDYQLEKLKEKERFYGKVKKVLFRDQFMSFVCIETTKEESRKK